MAGPAYAEHLATEVLRIVEARLRKYPWAGNVRELQGCMSNVHEQREYEPPSGYEPPPCPATDAARSREVASSPLAGAP